MRERTAQRRIGLWLAALSLWSIACNTADAEPVAAAASQRAGAGAPQHATTVHIPERLFSIEIGPSSSTSNTRVLCETCHGLRKDIAVPQAMSELDEFHQGLSFAHGGLSCASCHAASQPPKLKLADGRQIDLREALSLCAQCHGTQYRDYQHGAHGGLNGYWDISRGPRLKNHCVDCHDPHTPKIVAVKPVLPPRDRFFTKKEAH